MASEAAARRARLSAAAHLHHPIHAPLADTTVERLIAALEIRPGDRVVDIGCGSGEWLLRIASISGTAGLGLDTSAPSLRLARTRARAVSPSPAFQVVDASKWHPGTAFHRALCVGSTHALGGLEATLRRAHEILEPDGRLLVGEGFWQVNPTQAALAGLGARADELTDLDGLLAKFTEHGYAVLEQAVSTQAEWDDYETKWCEGAEALARENPGDRDSEWILSTAKAHRRGYEEGYRGVLGFVTAVLVARDS